MAQANSLTTIPQRRITRLAKASQPLACMTRAAWQDATDYGASRLELADLALITGNGCAWRGGLA